MKFYDEKILPHLIDFACGMGQVMKTRAQIVPQASGRVLEIGIGTGLNLSFYDAEKVSTIVGVDPAEHRHRDDLVAILQANAAHAGRSKTDAATPLPMIPASRNVAWHNFC